MSNTKQVVIAFPMNSGAAMDLGPVVREAGEIGGGELVTVVALTKIELDCPQLPEGQTIVYEISEHPSHHGFWAVGHIDQDRVCSFDLNLVHETILMVAKGLGQDITVKMTMDVRVDLPIVVEQRIEPVGEDDWPVNSADDLPSEV